MHAPAETGLEAALARVADITASDINDPPALESALREIVDAFLTTDLNTLDADQLRDQAPALIQRISLLRFHIRDRIEAWYANGLITQTAEVALRDAFRIMRYIVDMLGEHAIGNEERPADETPPRAFTGQEFNTVVHPVHMTGTSIRFQSGDILLVRGRAHNSAAIARVGDVDTQFSHTSLVYIDPDGKHWVVEALIEDGSVINTLEHALEHGNGRAVVYRCRDKAIAQRAAKLAYDRVKRSQSFFFRRHIPYDFSMSLEGRDHLFCSKLIQQAYLDASNGTVALPLFKTHFDPRSAHFYQAIGVTVDKTYAPADIDIDPRFDLIAEWRDYRTTPYLRRQDMALTKFFEWMELEGYRFKPTFAIRVISIFGKLSSYLSTTIKKMLESVVPRIPRGMPRSTIATITMLHMTAEEVMPELEEVSRQHVAQTKMPIDPRRLLTQMEEIRKRSEDGSIGYLKPPKR